MHHELRNAKEWPKRELKLPGRHEREEHDQSLHLSRVHPRVVLRNLERRGRRGSEGQRDRERKSILVPAIPQERQFASKKSVEGEE